MNVKTDQGLLYSLLVSFYIQSREMIILGINHILGSSQ